MFLPSNGVIVTVDRSDEPRFADVKFATGAVAPLSTTDADRMAATVRSFDALVLVAGLGARAGTHLSVHFAETARAVGVRTSAVVTTPFSFEGNRVAVARDGLSALSGLVDGVTTVDNDALADDLPDGSTLLEHYMHANDYALLAAVRAIRSALARQSA